MCTDEQKQQEVDLRMRIAEVSANLGEKIDDQLHDIARAMGDDLSGNANPYVPWSDPQIPFECDCGEIIYADTVHTHPETYFSRSDRLRLRQERDEMRRP